MANFCSNGTFESCACSTQSAKEGNKELLIIPGASHVDLYDDVAGVIPYDKMEAFFKENLK